MIDTLVRVCSQFEIQIILLCITFVRTTCRWVIFGQLIVLEGSKDTCGPTVKSTPSFAGPGGWGPIINTKMSPGLPPEGSHLPFLCAN